MKGMKGERRTHFKVLLIEDDEDDYVFLRDLLEEIERVDFKLDWVSTYHEGMEKITRGEYDVCLLDYRLGAGDGIGFIMEAKSSRLSVPIIILTGQREYRVDLEAMKTGAADYLVKDQINPDLLERVIRYSVNRAETTEALRKAQSELEVRVKERTAELEAAYVSLKKSSEKLKLFAYSIVHDLKNPAISVYRLTKRLMDVYGDNLTPKMQQHCVHIMQGSEQIFILVENINLLIATKESPLEIERLDLASILEEILEEFRDPILAQGISFQGPTSIPSIRADRLSLIRCLRNLIDNALRYGGERLSKIKMGIEETNHHFIISVNDNGIGMKKEDTETIFDPFQRSITSKGIDGTGLGLAIVKEIAEKHKGDVWARADGERGVTFFMSISRDL